MKQKSRNRKKIYDPIFIGFVAIMFGFSMYALGYLDGEERGRQQGINETLEKYNCSQKIEYNCPILLILLEEGTYRFENGILISPSNKTLTCKEGRKNV